MPKPYRLSPGRRLVNLLVRPLARLGLAGRRTHLLSVPGRTSGRLYTTPVSLVLDGDRRWAVAPYGERNWVLNARAAGWVELRRGRRVERVTVTELGPEAAVPVLRDYYRLGKVTRSFFDVDLSSPDADWVAEASRHPTFSLEPAAASTS